MTYSNIDYELNKNYAIKYGLVANEEQLNSYKPSDLQKEINLDYVKRNNINIANSITLELDKQYNKMEQTATLDRRTERNDIIRKAVAIGLAGVTGGTDNALAALAQSVTGVDIRRFNLGFDETKMAVKQGTKEGTESLGEKFAQYTENTTYKKDTIDEDIANFINDLYPNAKDGEKEMMYKMFQSTFATQGLSEEVFVNNIVEMEFNARNHEAKDDDTLNKVVKFYDKLKKRLTPEGKELYNYISDLGNEKYTDEAFSLIKKLHEKGGMSKLEIFRYIKKNLRNGGLK